MGVEMAVVLNARFQMYACGSRILHELVTHILDLKQVRLNAMGIITLFRILLQYVEK